MSSVVIEDIWYLLGGSREIKEDSKSVAYASLEQLLKKPTPDLHNRSAIPPEIDHIAINTVWKSFPDTPLYSSAAASLGGSLLTIGGRDRRDYDLPANPHQHVYSYSANRGAWIHIGDLPESRMWTTVASLSNTEMLVISGIDSTWDQLSTVYRAFLPF